MTDDLNGTQPSASGAHTINAPLTTATSLLTLIVGMSHEGGGRSSDPLHKASCTAGESSKALSLLHALSESLFRTVSFESTAATTATATATQMVLKEQHKNTWEEKEKKKNDINHHHIHHNKHLKKKSNNLARNIAPERRRKKEEEKKKKTTTQ